MTYKSIKFIQLNRTDKHIMLHAPITLCNNIFIHRIRKLLVQFFPILLGKTGKAVHTCGISKQQKVLPLLEMRDINYLQTNYLTFSIQMWMWATGKLWNKRAEIPQGDHGGNRLQYRKVSRTPLFLTLRCNILMIAVSGHDKYICRAINTAFVTFVVR